MCLLHEAKYKLCVNEKGLLLLMWRLHIVRERRRLSLRGAQTYTEASLGSEEFHTWGVDLFGLVFVHVACSHCSCVGFLFSGYSEKSVLFFLAFHFFYWCSFVYAWTPECTDSKKRKLLCCCFLLKPDAGVWHEVGPSVLGSASISVSVSWPEGTFHQWKAHYTNLKYRRVVRKLWLGLKKSWEEAFAL